MKRADEYAELTGRSKADVIADLLDDGQLNRSAGADIEPEKDLLDIAQEKAEKLKTLLITLAPMIALLSGVGLEGLGVLDFTDWGSDSVWEDDPNNNPNYPMVVWGCTDQAADNWDQGATDDDGSCSYPPEEIWGCTNDAAQNYDPEATHDDGSCEPYQEPVKGCTDSEAENYNHEAEEDDGSCTYPPEYEDEWADILNFDSLKDGDDGIELTIQINFNDDAEWNDDLRLRWTLWRDGETIPTEDEETFVDVRDANNEWVEFRFDGVGSGDWIPKVQAYYHDDLLDEETFDTITIGEPEPVECTVGFYAYQLSFGDANNTSLEGYADPDELTCGETVTVDVFFEITWASNGTVVWDALNTSDITGESWENMFFLSPTLSNGTYSATLELYIVIDGERAAEASEIRTWTEIEIGDGV